MQNSFEAIQNGKMKKIYMNELEFSNLNIFTD